MGLTAFVAAWGPSRQQHAYGIGNKRDQPMRHVDRDARATAMRAASGPGHRPAAAVSTQPKPEREAEMMRACEDC